VLFEKNQGHYYHPCSYGLIGSEGFYQEKLRNRRENKKKQRDNDQFEGIRPPIYITVKDGSWCMCVDYSALNGITVKDKSPIL